MGTQVSCMWGGDRDNGNEEMEVQEHEGFLGPFLDYLA